MAKDLHEVVCALKDLSLQLGRTPTKVEFMELPGISDHLIRKIGGFSSICQNAGLDLAVVEKSKKIDNSIFKKSISTQLDQYKPEEYKETNYPTIATISDIHWPFSCQRVIDKFYAFVEKHQPEYIFLNGDAWDMYSHSKYPRSHNIFTPRDEQAMARTANEIFWAKLRDISPNSICIQMMGNHDVRPLKRMLEVYPEAEDWVAEKMKSLFTFDGVRTVFDPRDEVVLGDIAIFHGYRSGLGAHRDYTLMNCINGHTHVGGAVFRQIRGQVIWELNSGVAGDPLAKGLTYTAQKITHWTPGFGFVDKFGPRFIPA